MAGEELWILFQLIFSSIFSGNNNLQIFPEPANRLSILYFRFF